MTGRWADFCGRLGSVGATYCCWLTLYRSCSWVTTPLTISGTTLASEYHLESVSLTPKLSIQVLLRSLSLFLYYVTLNFKERCHRLKKKEFICSLFGGRTQRWQNASVKLEEVKGRMTHLNRLNLSSTILMFLVGSECELPYKWPYNNYYPLNKNHHFGNQTEHGPATPPSFL